MALLVFLPFIWYLHLASPACDAPNVQRMSHGVDSCTRVDRWAHVD